MDTQPSKLDFHFFICTNAKEKGEDCARKGGLEVLEDLKKWVKEQKFSKKIRVNKSGCLGRCEEGIVAVAYPSNEWIVNLKASDLEEMKKFIQQRVQD